MRVLVSGVVLSQPAGGVRRHTEELLPRAAQLLAEEGGSLAVMEGAAPVAFPLPDAVERLPSSVPTGPPSLRALREGGALRAQLDAAATTGRPFDLVHTGHLPVPRKLPVPLAWTVHDLRRLEPGHSGRYGRLAARKALEQAVRAAAVAITVSDHVAGQLIDQVGAADARVHVVSNAADHLRPLPRAAGPGAPILYVGHLEPRKNAELLLRAMAHDPGLPALELAGASKGGEEARLRALAEELGVTARVRFAGSFDDAELPSMLSRAGCLALPSRVEGFGIPVIEAQRAQCPVAIAEAGALPEVAGPDAPRFGVDDPAGCSAALRSALDADEVAIARGAENAARYSWDASARALLVAWRAAAR